MIETWILTLVVTPVTYLGIYGGPTETMRIQLPQQEQCEAVREFLIGLDRLVPEHLYVGACVSVLKEETR